MGPKSAAPAMGTRTYGYFWTLVINRYQFSDVAKEWPLPVNVAHARARNTHIAFCAALQSALFLQPVFWLCFMTFPV